MTPLSILASGMVTGVGLTSAASCAAIRAGITGFDETRFVDSAGEWFTGSAVPFDTPVRGLEKLARLAADAVRECLEAARPARAQDVPLLLCVAEPSRPGRIDGLDDELLRRIEARLDVKFHSSSAVVANGRAGIAQALGAAADRLAKGRIERCIVAGADSYLVAPTLTALEPRFRILTTVNTDGFIPGEAGGAILVGPADAARGRSLKLLGLGAGREKAAVESEEPLRGDGLLQAMRAAIADSGRSFDAVDYRITDISGEQYVFKEAALAIGRGIRKVKPEFDLWHPSDCIGEVGAAIGPCVLGVALAAATKGYAPGPGVLCHFSNDDGVRAALVLRSE